MENPKIEIAVLVNGVVHKTTSLNTEQLIDDLHELESLGNIKYTMSDECIADFAFDLYATEHAQEDVQEALANPVISYGKGYIHGYWNQDGSESLVKHVVRNLCLRVDVYKDKIALAVEDNIDGGYDEVRDITAVDFALNLRDAEYLAAMFEYYNTVNRIDVECSINTQGGTERFTVYKDSELQQLTAEQLAVIKDASNIYVHREPMV